MRLPFNGNYPISRPFIAKDPNMPKALWDPIYGPTHRGIDFALPTGTDLYATIDGQITAAGWSPDGAGNLVVIRNGNLFVKYFHMSQVAVSVGKNVKAGDYVGKSGASGNATGPHLHLQVEQPFGTAIEPVFDKKVSEDVMNELDAKEAYRLVLHREPESEASWKFWVGKRFSDFAAAARKSNEWLHQNDLVLKGDERLKLIEQLQKSPDAKLAKVKELAKQIQEV